jgi:hypothetical protein
MWNKEKIINVNKEFLQLKKQAFLIFTLLNKYYYKCGTNLDNIYFEGITEHFIEFSSEPPILVCKFGAKDTSISLPEFDCFPIELLYDIETLKKYMKLENFKSVPVKLLDEIYGN